MKLLVVTLSPSSCHFSPVRSTDSPRQLVLIHAYIADEYSRSYCICRCLEKVSFALALYSDELLEEVYLMAQAAQ
jgi:hypothetical protein